MRLLLLEDSIRLSELTRECLQVAGYTVDVAHSIGDFRCLSQGRDHSIYVVDLGLPDGDASDLIRQLRSERRTTPILVTSGRSHVDDRIAVLDAGADDFLVKPFNCNELKARIRAVMRRPKELPSCRITAGNLELDKSTGEIFWAGRRLDLRVGERRLLGLLISRVGHVVPKALIEDLLYGVDVPTTSNAIEQLVSRLRKRVERSMGVALTTVRGDGYVLEVKQ